jgi:protein-S-isoprenylcysteine O-methyltransferase Ste14/NAD-dependent dihydropyrimidine dehydrogenase PreA subunit
LPIDPDFRKKRKRMGKEKGIAVWPADLPDGLGIRGTDVAVDWDICNGCGICLDLCPMHVYQWIETSGHPTSEKRVLPAKESDCVQCYTCESECPTQAIRVTFGGPPGWQKAVVIPMMAQIIGGIVYGTFFGPYLGLEILRYVGWIVLAVGLPFFFSPAIWFPRKGKPQEGKSLMDTTVVVESGTYGIVRHPQILGCILLMLASALVSQHWLTTIPGVLMTAWFYTELPKEERGLILKFGDLYKRYMQKVPRMNLLLGVIRLLCRKGIGN